MHPERLIPVSPRLRLSALSRLLFGLLAALSIPQAARAATSPTLTTLTLSAASVPAKTAVTFTAAVNSGPTAVHPGQVRFCDAAYPSCTDIHLLGTAQLTSAGTATMKFIPGPGTHTYKAVFAGTNIYASSASPAQSLTVTISSVPASTTATAQSTGVQGNYTLLGNISSSSANSPTGAVSFLDTTNANYNLGSATLSASPTSDTLAFSKSFSFPTPSTTGETTVVGDFNNDGIPDLAISNFSKQTVSIMLGNGDGTFAVPVAILPTGLGPSSLLVADFNQDGKQDLIISTTVTNTATLYSGRGDGTFSAGPSLPALPSGISAFLPYEGDFNNDGIPDLARVVVSGGPGSSTYALQVLLGNGDGSFTAVPTQTPVAFEYNAIVIADFNNDGVADLALAGDTQNGSLTVLLGRGDGTFRALAPFNVGINYASLAAVDLNNDGKTDLVVTNLQNLPTSILLGNGDGTFTTLPPDPVLAQPGLGISIADFNQDGVPDLALADPASGNLRFFFGKGDGTFSTSTVLATSADGFTTADFNGDGHPDLAVGVFNLNAASTNRIDIYLSQSSSSSSATLANVSPVGTGTHYIAATYPGDAFNSAAVSTPIPLLAQQVPTVTLLTASPAAVASSNQPVTLTATLNQSFAQNHNASGPVSFTSNGQPLGTASIANGSATLTLASLPSGADSLTATYAGDTNFTGSISNSIAFTVNPVLGQPQTITFPALNTPAYDATSVGLFATATSGLPITYTVLSGPASVTGTTLTYTGLGLVTVQAAQAGGAGFSAATPVTNTVTTQLVTEPLGGLTEFVTVILFKATGILSDISVTTQGAPSLDFTYDGRQASSCVIGAMYAAGQSCFAQIRFLPTHPGPRFGGITLTDAQGNLLASSYLLGEGTGPQLFYLPPTQSFAGHGFGFASGAAINGAGDLFVSDLLAGVYEVSATTGATRLVTPLLEARDVIVDGNGNVFAANLTDVIEIMAIDGSIPAANPTVRTLATGFNEIDGLKVDSNGDVFVADGGLPANQVPVPGLVSEIVAVNGIIPNNPTILPIGSGYGILTGVAVDVNGNVFASDQAKQAVFEVHAVNGVIPANPAITTVGSGFILPANVAFDGVGDLFVPDIGTRSIREVLAVNGVIPANPTIVDLGSGITQPNGLVVDPAGNVFIADAAYTQLVELNYGIPPTLTFTATPVNTTSPDSPKAFTISNAGNADLGFLTPVSGNNPTISASFTIDAGSTCPTLGPNHNTAFALHPTQSCTTAIDFLPTAVGPITGTVVRTDNNLNIAGSIQTVKLVGNGLALAPTIVFNVPNHNFIDPPFSVAATSNSPAPFIYTVVSGPATIVGNPAGTATVTLTGAGTVTLQAAQAASGIYTAGSANATFQVAKLSQTITFAQPATPIPFTAAPITLNATASSGLPVVFSILSGPARVSGTTLTITGGGTIVVAADQPGNANYAPAAEVTRTITVTFGLPTVTLAAAPNPVFLHNPVTLSAAVSSPAGTPSGTVSFVDTFGAAAVPTPIGIAPIVNGQAMLATSALAVGTHSITAVYSGDLNFASLTSSPVVVLVEDFSLVITNPTLTIPHGGTGVYNFVVTSVGGAGLASTITLTTTGQPEYSTYVFAPAIIGAGSGTTQGTLTIHTPDFPSGPFYLGRLAGGGTFTLAALFALILPRRRRRRSLLATTLLLVCALASTTLIAGCGSGWKTQHWFVTVTATSGNLTRTAQATLTSHP